MINELLIAVIKKHGPVKIEKINQGSGIFRISISNGVETMSEDCFRLSTGLIALLDQDTLGLKPLL
jgi:hypothetical protein